MSVVSKGIVHHRRQMSLIVQQMENEEAADTEIVLYIDRSEQSWRRILKLDVANLIIQSIWMQYAVYIHTCPSIIWWEVACPSLETLASKRQTRSSPKYNDGVCLMT
jgi:hypothetical protein